MRSSSEGSGGTRNGDGLIVIGITSNGGHNRYSANDLIRTCEALYAKGDDIDGYRESRRHYQCADSAPAG